MNEKKYSAVCIRTNKEVVGQLKSKVSPTFTDIKDDLGIIHIVFSSTLKTL